MKIDNFLARPPRPLNFLLNELLSRNFSSVSVGNRFFFRQDLVLKLKKLLPRKKKFMNSQQFFISFRLFLSMSLECLECRKNCETWDSFRHLECQTTPKGVVMRLFHIFGYLWALGSGRVENIFFNPPLTLRNDSNSYDDPSVERCLPYFFRCRKLLVFAEKHFCEMRRNENKK